MANPGGPEQSAELHEPFMLSPDAPPPDSGHRRGLWLGLLIGGLLVALAALVVVPAVSGGFGGSPDAAGAATSSARQFEINGCVRSDDAEAVAIDCTEAETGDYQITGIVEASGECPDQTMPVVKTGDEVYCLKPYRE